MPGCVIVPERNSQLDYALQGALQSERLGGSVLGDCLGTLRHSVLGEFTGKGEAHSSLDLTGREGGLLGVASELASLSSQTVEDVTDERVEDGDTTLGDTGIGVDLLQHL